MSWFKRAWWFVVSAGLLVLTGWLLAVQAPQAWQEERAIRDADKCAVSEPADDADCRSVRELTVEEVREDTSGRGSTYWVTVTGRDPAARVEVEFGVDKPVVKELRPGERVRGTEWQGDIIELSASGRSQQAWGHPGNTLRTWLFFGSLSLVGAAMTLRAGMESLGPDGSGPRITQVRVLLMSLTLIPLFFGTLLELEGVLTFPRWAAPVLAAAYAATLLLPGRRPERPVRV